jgi:hypothetical protein
MKAFRAHTNSFGAHTKAFRAHTFWLLFWRGFLDDGVIINAIYFEEKGIWRVFGSN